MRQRVMLRLFPFERERRHEKKLHTTKHVQVVEYIGESVHMIYTSRCKSIRTAKEQGELVSEEDSDVLLRPRKYHKSRFV